MAPDLDLHEGNRISVLPSATDLVRLNAQVSSAPNADIEDISLSIRG
jgi:hypothetical protein